MQSSLFPLGVFQNVMTIGATAVVQHHPQVLEETLFLHLFVRVPLAQWRRLGIPVQINKVRWILQAPDVQLALSSLVQIELRAGPGRVSP